MNKIDLNCIIGGLLNSQIGFPDDMTFSVSLW